MSRPASKLHFVPWLRAVLLVALTVCVAACGGGGGGGDGNSGAGSNNAGGGSSATNGPNQAPIAPTAANTVPITVGSGVAGVPNIPTVSVTLCVSGTSNCQTVNNVQVDTASFGLRIVASALSPLAASLPVNTVGNGAPLAECTAFADGYTWGTVRTADVKIGGETASAIPLQVIGDLPASTVPQACANIGAAQSSASDLGANGILGIGVAPYDCGTNCTLTAANSNYYACPGNANCSNTTVTLAQQVANPVPHFAADNNGVIVQMPSVADTGAASASGTLVFGIGTQSNNAMSATQSFRTTQWGDLPGSTFNGRALTAFLDSGSNGLFFADSALTQCTGSLASFYCPSSPQTLGATLLGTDGTSGNVSFNVRSASTLLGNSSNFAFNDLAGLFGSSADLDLGLPFFYGRNVYFGYAGSGGSPAPIVAF